MSKTRVLIIEDEKLIRWSLRQRFDEEGYIADEAETGRQGACSPMWGPSLRRSPS